MYNNVHIACTGIFHPTKKIYNDYFIEHFQKKGVRIDGLLKAMGRRKRYLADTNETVLTMALKAAQNAMEKINMSAKDLDMIVFVTDTPEYTSPSHALIMNKLLGAENAHTVFDMNSNCVGMLVAIDVISKYVQSKNQIKNILIVGSLLISPLVDINDSLTYPIVGDCAAAVILQNREEEEKKGLLDSTYFTDSSYYKNIRMPKSGFSKMYSQPLADEEKKWYWEPFDLSFLADNWVTIIDRLLERNNLDINEINQFIFSQLSDTYNMETLKKLGVQDGKYTFVGTEYGYTGSTSPIVALNRIWDTVAIKDNYVIFCSIGSGYTLTALLYHF